MDLIKNVITNTYGCPEGEVWFELFDKYINFAVEDAADIDYAQLCAQYLNSQPESVIKDLCEASIRYCNNFLEAIGEPEKEFENYRDILQLIYPSVLLIPDPENNNEPILHMELNCEWEEEHGMEWVVRNNEVLYVGASNGVYPWGSCDAGEFWNYA
jgi:hypothetical protein